MGEAARGKRPRGDRGRPLRRWPPRAYDRRPRGEKRDRGIRPRGRTRGRGDPEPRGRPDVETRRRGGRPGYARATGRLSGARAGAHAGRSIALRPTEAIGTTRDDAR